MNTEKLQKRDSSLDIVRIVAVFTVLSVHFFTQRLLFSARKQLAYVYHDRNENPVLHLRAHVHDAYGIPYESQKA